MSKKILHTFLALAAALILTGGFSMTAYAGGGEEYEVTEPTPEPKPEETAEPSDPLTPEGNATLVDDIWGENKQLITVTTKNGNYFYILIDRAAEGENTVHFLNMVDEADLMALIEDGEKEETTVMPQTCTCKEKCEAGAVNESCPVCLNNRNSCIGIEKETEPETEAEPLEGVNKIAKTIENKGFSRKGKADGKNFVRWKPLHILERCKEKRQGKAAVRHGLGIVFKL